jgi:hypothetical protein
MRFKPMAKDLDVSDRTLRTLLMEGCPHIKRGRLIWLDPKKVFKWLNRFERRVTK